MARAGRKQAKTRADRGDGRTGRGQFAPGASGNPGGRSSERYRPVILLDANGARNDEQGQGWASAFTGIGMPSRDKRLGHQYYAQCITYTTAQDLWATDDLACRVIEAPPNECLRQGWELTIGEEQGFDDLKELVESAVEDLLINEAVELAYKYERAYGGAAILLGVNDGQAMDQPLDPERVTEFSWVNVLEPIECYPIAFYDDPAGAKYGHPRLYQLNRIGTIGVPMTAAQLIHESRLIVFDGIRVSRFQARSGPAGAYWGDSILTRIASVLRDFNIAWAGAGILASDFSQSVFSMQDFAVMVANGDWQGIADRFAGIEMGRSTARAVVIDNNEKFERQTTNISGLPDLLDRLSSRFAAAADMPLTLLMGQSPKGLGNEGDSDVRFYYDRISAIQKRKIRRPLRRMVELIMRTVGTRQVPQKWDVKFHALWQLSDVEKATARLTQATADEKYVLMDAVSPREIRDSRFGGEYSFETTLDEQAFQEHESAAAAEPDPAALAAMGRAPRVAKPEAPAVKEPAPAPGE